MEDLLMRRLATGNLPQTDQLRRGRSLLAREEDVHDSSLTQLRRGSTRRRRSSPSKGAPDSNSSCGCLGDIGPGPKDAWFIYCYIITIWAPSFLLSACGTSSSWICIFAYSNIILGLKSPEQQRAWREKMGLIAIVAVLMAAVGFITFGFTETVCGTPPNRFHSGSIGNSSVIIHGEDYDFSKFNHPAAGSTFDGHTNPLFEGGWGAAGGDISFLFQNVNQNCLNIITRSNTSSISGSENELDWYFPCNVFNQFGTSPINSTNYGSSTSCHVSTTARSQLAAMHPQGQVYYTWDDVRNGDRNLVVFES